MERLPILRQAQDEGVGADSDEGAVRLPVYRQAWDDDRRGGTVQEENRERFGISMKSSC